MTIPIVLTIAGSDSGGGAGIQADLKTFHAFGCFGTSAVTAITVQNTRGVTGVHAVPVDTVREQIRAVAQDLPARRLQDGDAGHGGAGAHGGRVHPPPQARPTTCWTP